jgi:nucleotide-binding universal stress UspA family protein
MFQEIVVPVDGSRFGEKAIPVALGIAGRTRGRVRILTVITPLPLDESHDEPGPTEEGRLLLATNQADAYHRELEKRVKEEGCEVPLSFHVETGSVVEALDRHARGSGADLLVLTTHGRGPLRRAWLGSVADGLIRRMPCPILAVRPGDSEGPPSQDWSFRHMLVTLDGSAESKNILPFAKALARAAEARMTLLRVIPRHYPVSSPYPSHTGYGLQNLEEEAAAARNALEKIAVPLMEEGYTVESETVSATHPAEGILDFVEQNKVDLVAMETHGRGGVARLILGSVADKVIRGATVPILVHRSEVGVDQR